MTDEVRGVIAEARRLRATHLNRVVRDLVARALHLTGAIAHRLMNLFGQKGAAA